MATAQDFLYRINAQVLPDDYKPTRCAVIHPQPSEDVVNFNREPGGAQGYTFAVLTWEDMPAAARAWLDAFIGAGRQKVDLTDLVLPDSHSSAGTVTEGTDDYPQHGEWTSATMWRVQLPEGYTEDFRTTSAGRVRFILGTCTIRITNIGA